MQGAQSEKRLWNSVILDFQPYWVLNPWDGWFGVSFDVNSLNMSSTRSLNSELREQIKPEIQELIKQQRLNYLVAGTRFNRLRQAGKLSGESVLCV